MTIYRENLKPGDIFTIPSDPTILLGYVNGNGRTYVVDDGEKASRYATDDELAKAVPSWPMGINLDTLDMVCRDGRFVTMDAAMRAYQDRVTKSPRPALPTEPFSKIRLDKGVELILAPCFGISEIDGVWWRDVRHGTRYAYNEIVAGSVKEVLRVGA